MKKFAERAERQETAAAAKKAMLERFKPKPHVIDPNLEARKAAAAAELEAVRAARSAERDAKRIAAAEAERLRLEDEAITQEARDLDLRARQKEARDLRYVA
ncbi:MAG: DUF6481 family protein, partial [Phenylobacterium sp.]|uniref:DUF6481 family protein n=1 Tax=Phenylobacterium sp. TaxID=1871053 RepID=UPI003015C39D